MSSEKLTEIVVGAGASARPIAVHMRAGSAPGLFWLNGFRSVMSGTKATHLDALGAARGLAVTRFDYSGHGRSGGAFDDGTISRWLKEAAAVLALTEGPQIVCGSSMGGWIALLLARRQLALGRPLSGLVLIAPAVDATATLIRARIGLDQQRDLDHKGWFETPSAYGDGPYRYTRGLLEDGAAHLLMGGIIETGCPVHILQGARDTDVPASHSRALLSHILHDPVTYTLVPDGDHRLSRPQDLALFERAVLGLATVTP